MGYFQLVFSGNTQLCFTVELVLHACMLSPALYLIHQPHVEEHDAEPAGAWLVCVHSRC